MIRIAFVTLLMTLPVLQAQAEPSSRVAFDKATLALLAGANSENGKKEAVICSTCHGENGIAVLHEAANVAGQPASYLFKQLKDFNDGHRIEHEMNRFARNLSDQQIADLSVWFASLPSPAHTAPDNTDEAILKLVHRGDPQRLLKACSSCHGRKGQGGQFSHPLIAGQTQEYLIQSLEDFRDGGRNNDIWSRMRIVAEKLTDEEIKGLADYYAGTSRNN